MFEGKKRTGELHGSRYVVHMEPRRIFLFTYSCLSPMEEAMKEHKKMAIVPTPTVLPLRRAAV